MMTHRVAANGIGCLRKEFSPGTRDTQLWFIRSSKFAVILCLSDQSILITSKKAFKPRGHEFNKKSGPRSKPLNRNWQLRKHSKNVSSESFAMSFMTLFARGIWIKKWSFGLR